MNTLDYILKKFNIIFDKKTPMPIEILNFGRDNLAVLFVELGFKTGAEIGVERGIYSEILLKNMPGLKLYSIDPWEFYPNYQNYPQDELNRIYEEAKARLAPYNCEIIKKYSLDAVKDFPDQSLDFVYIDGVHDFQNVTNDVVEWSKKVKVGGIVSGHDYIRRHNNHVCEVLNAYFPTYGIRPWFVLGSNAKIPGIIRDRYRSWMFVKQ